MTDLGLKMFFTLIIHRFEKWKSYEKNMENTNNDD